LVFSPNKNQTERRSTHEDGDLSTGSFGAIKEIQRSPEGLFDIIRVNIEEGVGQHLSELMKMELRHFSGRKRYQRCQKKINHHNVSDGRKFTLKDIAKVGVLVPRDGVRRLTTVKNMTHRSGGTW
jgi:hypothetical protein